MRVDGQRSTKDRRAVKDKDRDKLIKEKKEQCKDIKLLSTQVSTCVNSDFPGVGYLEKN